MSKRVQTGTLYVNGSCLGPAERDPSTGVIESGPHVTARAAVTGIRVSGVTQSPTNGRRWCLTLACGHDVWITAKRRPTRTTSPCGVCQRSR